MERTKILDVNERRGFRTIYEAINWSVGENYTYWGRACWPNGNPQDGFRMWFTQLAYIEKGRYVPAVNNCLNLLCSNGNYHVYDRIGPSDKKSIDTINWKYDLLFSKEVGGLYYFRGVFVADYAHSAPNHRVSKRVATKVKLIGCPARKLELLELVDADIEFDEDYLKKHVASYDVVDASRNYKNKVETTTQSTLSKAPKKVVQEPKVDYSAVFTTGCRVKHRSFGCGIVKECIDDRLTIEFDDGFEKQLGAEFCVKNKLIAKI